MDESYAEGKLEWLEERQDDAFERINALERTTRHTSDLIAGVTSRLAALERGMEQMNDAITDEGEPLRPPYTWDGDALFNQNAKLIRESRQLASRLKQQTDLGIRLAADNRALEAQLQNEKDRRIASEAALSARLARRVDL